jgi:flavin reductase (DIM6/NTAB) family NADH-FMN oxidoreductase RutF
MEPSVTEALAELPLPVAVVAAAHAGERSCGTGTLTYVSYEPALVATPLAATSRTLSLLRESGEFSLSILASNQAELAVRAARPSSGDKFVEQAIPLLSARLPAVAGAALVLFCEVESATASGPSVVCLGRVRGFVRGEGGPLLRYGHRYRALGAHIDVVEEASYSL